MFRCLSRVLFLLFWLMTPSVLAENGNVPLCVSVTLKGALQTVQLKEGDEAPSRDDLSFGAPIELGTILRVREKGRAKILCNGDTLLTLLERGELQLVAGDLTQKTPYLPWMIKLTAGSLRVDRYGEDEKVSLPYLRLVTPNALIRSRSGSALFSYYENSQITDVAVFDGSVELRNSENLKAPAVKIAAGEVSRATAKLSPSHPVKMEKIVMKRFLTNSSFSLELPPDPMFDLLVLPLLKEKSHASSAPLPEH